MKQKRSERRKHELRQRRATIKRTAATGGIVGFLRREWHVLRAILVFAGCLALALFAYSRLIDSEFIDPVVRFTAGTTAFLINIFGGGVTVSGITVSSSRFSMDIVTECTGLLPILLFLCAVIAFPSPLKTKLAGAAIGIMALFVLNLVRTSSLFFVGRSFPSFLDTAHFLVWQTLMILAAIFLWLLWVEKMARARPT